MKADTGTLSPCTQEVTPIRLIPSDDNRELGRAVLVDAPGFDEDIPAARHRQIISMLSHWFHRQLVSCSKLRDYPQITAHYCLIAIGPILICLNPASYISKTYQGDHRR